MIIHTAGYFALRKVEGDYDVYSIDCAPGVLLHDNIFKALIFFAFLYAYLSHLFRSLQ